MKKLSLLACLALVLVPASSFASAERLSLQTTGHYQVRVDGGLDMDATVYKVQRGIPHFLIVSDSLESAWLIAAVERAARPLAKDAIVPLAGAEGSVSVVPPEGDEGKSDIQIDGANVSFRTPTGFVTMEPREPLVGDLSLEQMLDYMPEYRRAASAFEPARGQLLLLREVEQDVVVDVYFGTWCPHCEKLVPRMIKLASVVDNPKLQFRFRGVPGRIADDPMARQYKIDGVPMALVRRGDEVLARLMGRELMQPETSINAALLGADS